MTPASWSRRAAAATLIALMALPARAAPPPRTVTNTLAVSVNPIGLQDQLGLGWRWGLSRSTNPFLSDAHLALGVTNSLSPASERLEAWVELSPLSVLDIRAGVEPVFYFGTFGHISGFPSYDADFSQDAREAVKDRAASRTGVRYHVSPAFKIKLGRVLARTGVELEWWHVDTPDPYFYEPLRDTLLASGGDAVAVVTAQAFYEANRGPESMLLLGAHYDRITVHDAPQNRRQRAGPIAVFRLGARRLGLRDPTVIGALLRYVSDPSKEGDLGGFVAASFTVGAR